MNIPDQPPEILGETGMWNCGTQAPAANESFHLGFDSNRATDHVSTVARSVAPAKRPQLQYISM
jgi:hypothetical protein